MFSDTGLLAESANRPKNGPVPGRPVNGYAMAITRKVQPNGQAEEEMTLWREIRCFILGLGLVAAAGHAADLSPGGAPAGQPPAAAGKIVARVNGEPISEAQVNTEMEKKWGGSRRRGVRKASPDVEKGLRRKALDEIIGDQVILQESRKLKIDDLEQKVEQRRKALEAKYGAGEGLANYLKRRSLTLDELKKALRTRVCVDEYLKRQGISEPEIPEDRVRRMYEENRKSYTREAAVHVSHVLIAVDEHVGAEAQEKARQKAEQIRAEIVKGKDFAEMAKQHSNCNSASGGGDLGAVKKGYMPPEFDRVAFALDKGGVSEVVKTKFGYHIVKVLDKSPAGVIPYEEMRDFLRKYLQQEESRKKLASHVVELKKQSKIEILSQ
jgi:peptidyl-prolyl cis-trans isomerase C